MYDVDSSKPINLVEIGNILSTINGLADYHNFNRMIAMFIMYDVDSSVKINLV